MVMVMVMVLFSYVCSLSLCPSLGKDGIRRLKVDYCDVDLHFKVHICIAISSCIFWDFKMFATSIVCLRLIYCETM